MNKQTEKNSAASTCPSCPVPSPTTLELELAAVLDRIEAECFSRRDRKAVEEIALAIVQMERKHPGAICCIQGEAVTAADVQAIYSRLTHDHVAAVLDKYRRLRETVRKPLPYIQAMLYNIVHELELGVENDIAVAGG